MSDITANVVVTNPRPIFTDSRTFKAVANGRIYIGQIDTDPVNPSNQIPVFIENEDGTLVQISQPLVINNGGKIVYNGQLVKVVTQQGHSMAIYDSYGSQVDYIANILTYDPAQFIHDLAQPDGAENIGVQPQGNLAQLLTYVTPEQFGAIGDGTIHYLSEKYSTLSAAQAVYPFVTSLTQTIDWAACQAAENYARGKCRVVAREFAEYHFGRDGLMISQYSHWQGGMTVSQGIRNCAFKKSFPDSTPVFQKDYIVRVSPEQNDNPFGTFYYKDNISFKGFRLYYDVPRRYPTKGTNTICFHMGDMVKGELDIAAWGAEYGEYTWVAWGNTGHIRNDNCHKGFFSVPHLGDNERSGSGTITSNHLNIECDVTPFPITIGRDSYSHYTGYFEGSVTTDGNYDSANETACGITIIDSCTGLTFNMGIEKWQGVHVTKASSGAAEASFRFGWFTDDHYKMSSGNDGSDASLRTILGSASSRIQLPPSQRAYLNNIAGNTSFTFHDTSWYMGGVFTEITSTRYLVNIQSSASVFSFIGGSTGFTPESGAAPVSFSITEQMKARVEIVGCRNMELWCAPSTTWKLIGRNRWRQTTQTNVTGTLVTGAGYYADFTPPSGYVVAAVDRLTINLGINTASAIQNAPSLIAYEPVNGSGMPAGAVRAATSFSGGTAPTFNAVLEITQ
ncbi:phage head-binding domain-containing protein [Pseudocitrobacter faecalis]|uniref:phage head-binding domain-containing protein n=1 Tax=Pseudocitrobacter faecalis TaxID=1398493 RepID=UPI00331539AB